MKHNLQIINKAKISCSNIHTLASVFVAFFAPHFRFSKDLNQLKSDIFCQTQALLPHSVFVIFCSTEILKFTFKDSGDHKMKKSMAQESFQVQSSSAMLGKCLQFRVSGDNKNNILYCFLNPMFPTPQAMSLIGS